MNIHKYMYIKNQIKIKNKICFQGNSLSFHEFFKIFNYVFSVSKRIIIICVEKYSFEAPNYHLNSQKLTKFKNLLIGVENKTNHTQSQKLISRGNK